MSFLNSRPKNIAIIGAGLGGLAVSIRLAARGHRIKIYEKNPNPGGKIQEVMMDGFRFDAGPALLTLPDLLADLFDCCGEKMDDHLTLIQPDPICRYFYPDSTIFDNFQDMEKTIRQIEDFASSDTESWSEFLRYSEKLYERTSDSFLSNPLYQWSDMKSLNLLDSLRIDAFSTVSKRVDKFFDSEKLRQFFKRFTTYSGSSPFQAPATLNVIPFVEIIKGGFYVRGGMYRVVEALERIALKSGVRIRYNTCVRRIEIENSKVKGVALDNGSSESCDIAVSNSDSTDTILNLIDSRYTSPSKRKRLEQLEPSCSGFVLLLGTNRKWNQLRHHNVFFSSDYEKEFRQIFSETKLPSDPTIYVTDTSFTDPGDAPSNGSNLFILVNSPWLSEDQDWDVIRKTYSRKIMETLEQYGLKDLSATVQTQKTVTPVDFRNQFRAVKGSLYGPSSNRRLAAFLRPSNKLKTVQGVYLVGGSTHPGGGIPLVLHSARNTSDLIGRFEES